MLTLPEKFILRARAALKGEADEFLSAYSRPPVKGIRVNSLKIFPAEFKKISPFDLEEIPWEENGFYVSEEKVGSSPYHAAGLYYSQEPSAMLPASLLDVKAGERVLDLCSAPGGKGTQLAQKMNGKGIIVLNEYVSFRAKILSQNVERLGIRNAVVLNESPERLAATFQNYFDKILVDAPCSGEGMFRKNSEEALSNWCEENILMCAERQRGILSAAAKMLAGGGTMVYSTCTFSPEEDEGQTKLFLKEHPEFTLIKEEKLLPHRVRGEGHYAAAFKKSGSERLSQKPVKPIKEDKDIAVYRKFEEEFLNFSFKNLYRAGELLYSLPGDMFDFSKLNVLRVGVRLGEFIKGRFEPSHSLAMCLKEEECKNFVPLNIEAAEKFLHGETLPLPSPSGEGGGAFTATTDEGCKSPDTIKNGWCVVGIGDYPLGLGKISGGMIKNHYPKGLRKT